MVTGAHIVLDHAVADNHGTGHVLGGEDGATTVGGGVVVDVAVVNDNVAAHVESAALVHNLVGIAVADFEVGDGGRALKRSLGLGIGIEAYEHAVDGVAAVNDRLVVGALLGEAAVPAAGNGDIGLEADTAGKDGAAFHAHL